MSLRRIDRLPRNFNEFIEEVALGLGALYGPAAEAEYRAKAVPGVQATLSHPAVDGLAVFQGDRAAGVLLATLRGGVGHISFLHVLHDFASRGVEQRLTAECVRTLRAGGVEGIVCDCITFCLLDEDGAFGDLGFTRIERAVLGSRVDHPVLWAAASSSSRPFRQAERAEVAQIIVEAYRGHPDRDLHSEVRAVSGALNFVNSVCSGGYGLTRAEFGRTVDSAGVLAGVILGCQVAPDVGFVLQVAVRQEFQGQGIGSELMGDLARCCEEARLDRLALGVTVDNPARRLYERLGFETWRLVNAYVWWR